MGPGEGMQPVCERIELLVFGEDETMAVGRALAGALLGGERIGLSGELGAGKTCLVRGLAGGLGVPPENVHSPSFTMLLPYDGGRLPLYHLDLFRIQPGPEDCLALREVLYGDGVAVVEWCEQLSEPLRDFLHLSLTFVGTNARRLVAVGHGVGYGEMLGVLRRFR